MFTIKIDDADAQKKLSALAKAAKRPRKALQEIGAKWKTEIQLGFKDGKDPWGSPWLPLSILSTLIREDKWGNLSRKGDKPLRDTGRLSRSFHYRTTNDQLRIGTNTEYAGTHQFGAKRGAYGKMKNGAPIPWGNIPARPMLPIRGGRVDLPKHWGETAIGVMLDHLEGAVD